MWTSYRPWQAGRVIVSVDYGEVRYFRMARTVFGRASYWTGVYFVDGLLVDSGPPNLAREVARLCRELPVRQCATTHHHEDHSGNHRLLAERLGIRPLAHALGIAPIAAPEPLEISYGPSCKDKIPATGSTIWRIDAKEPIALAPVATLDSPAVKKFPFCQ